MQVISLRKLYTSDLNTKALTMLYVVGLFFVFLSLFFSQYEHFFVFSVNF